MFSPTKILVLAFSKQTPQCREQQVGLGFPSDTGRGPRASATTACSPLQWGSPTGSHLLACSWSWLRAGGTCSSPHSVALHLQQTSASRTAAITANCRNCGWKPADSSTLVLMVVVPWTCPSNHHAPRQAQPYHHPGLRGCSTPQISRHPSPT